MESDERARHLDIQLNTVYNGGHIGTLQASQSLLDKVPTRRTWRATCDRRLDERAEGHRHPMTCRRFALFLCPSQEGVCESKRKS